MSAPETNDLPPAPVRTTTRTSSSLAKSSRIFAAACHISSDTALCRSGLLKIIVPTCPSLRASILSLGSMRLSSDHLGLLQLLDLRVREAELAQHLDRVLSAAGRRSDDPARSAAQGHRLSHDPQRAAVGRDLAHDPQVFDLRVGEHLVDGVDETARDAGLVQAFDPFRAGTSRQQSLQL